MRRISLLLTGVVLACALPALAQTPASQTPATKPATAAAKPAINSHRHFHRRKADVGAVIEVREHFDRVGPGSQQGGDCKGGEHDKSAHGGKLRKCESDG